MVPDPLLAALAFPDFDPVLVSIGPLAIRWYGLAYVAGLLLGWLYVRSLVSRPALWRRGAAGGAPPFTTVDADDFLLWAAAGIILGGRLGYVLFYDLPSYIADPALVLRIWAGGMSFHGGLAGIILAMLLFARSRGFTAYSLFDVVAAAGPIGLFFGRLANFINGELWGRPTDLPWGVVFPMAGPEPRHPSQLYEALLEGLVLFLVLRVLTHSQHRLAQPGFVGGAFLFGYGLARIAVEFVRTPDPQVGYLAGGWLTMGMMLCLPMLMLGLWGMMTAPGRSDRLPSEGAASPA